MAPMTSAEELLLRMKKLVEEQHEFFQTQHPKYGAVAKLEDAVQVKAQSMAPKKKEKPQQEPPGETEKAANDVKTEEEDEDEESILDSVDFKRMMAMSLRKSPRACASVYTTALREGRDQESRRNFVDDIREQMVEKWKS